MQVTHLTHIVCSQTFSDTTETSLAGQYGSVHGGDCFLPGDPAWQEEEGRNEQAGQRKL